MALQIRFFGGQFFYLDREGLSQETTDQWAQSSFLFFVIQTMFQFTVFGAYLFIHTRTQIIDSDLVSVSLHKTKIDYVLSTSFEFKINQLVCTTFPLLFSVIPCKFEKFIGIFYYCPYKLWNCGIHSIKLPC